MPLSLPRRPLDLLRERLLDLDEGSGLLLLRSSTLLLDRLLDLLGLRERCRSPIFHYERPHVTLGRPSTPKGYTRRDVAADLMN